MEKVTDFYRALQEGENSEVSEGEREDEEEWSEEGEEEGGSSVMISHRS
jgi:hypothetical protein